MIRLPVRITAWNWSFGDGDFSELQDPVHTYISHGNYTVSLNISDSFSFDFQKRITSMWIGSPRRCPSGSSPAGTVYLGESGLNITQCMGPNTTLAWFAPGAPGRSCPGIIPRMLRERNLRSSQTLPCSTGAPGRGITADGDALTMHRQPLRWLTLQLTSVSGITPWAGTSPGERSLWGHSGVQYHQ